MADWLTLNYLPDPLIEGYEVPESFHNDCSGSSADGGGGQIVLYTTTGPTADGVTPNNVNGEAIAVKPGGSTFTWDSTLHVWDDV